MKNFNHNISLLKLRTSIWKRKHTLLFCLIGITSLVLMLPLYPKVADYSCADKQDFKVRLANVKLKETDLRAKENLSPNRVALRSKTLKKVS